MTEHKDYKILALNFGSTSTKIAVYEGNQKMLEHAFRHTQEEMNGVHTM